MRQACSADIAIPRPLALVPDEAPAALDEREASAAGYSPGAKLIWRQTCPRLPDPVKSRPEPTYEVELDLFRKTR